MSGDRVWRGRGRLWPYTIQRAAMLCRSCFADQAKAKGYHSASKARSLVSTHLGISMMQEIPNTGKKSINIENIPLSSFPLPPRAVPNEV